MSSRKSQELHTSYVCYFHPAPLQSTLTYIHTCIIMLRAFMHHCIHFERVQISHSLYVFVLQSMQKTVKTRADDHGACRCRCNTSNWRMMQHSLASKQSSSGLPLSTVTPLTLYMIKMIKAYTPYVEVEKVALTIGTSVGFSMHVSALSAGFPLVGPSSASWNAAATAFTPYITSERELNPSKGSPRLNTVAATPGWLASFQHCCCG